MGSHFATVLTKFLTLNEFRQDDDFFEISYKHWVTADWCNLVTFVEPYVDFMDNLLKKLEES
jgi:hypothetical protein